jgi:hypothetical protein
VDTCKCRLLQVHECPAAEHAELRVAHREYTRGYWTPVVIASAGEGFRAYAATVTECVPRRLPGQGADATALTPDATSRCQSNLVASAAHLER